jgi:hypothetical protein
MLTLDDPRTRMAPRKREERTDPSAEQKSQYAVSAENRRQPMTLDALRVWAREVRETLAAFDRELKKAESYGLDSVPIDGVKKFANAGLAMTVCLKAVAKGVADARY